jgi:hypothetical protein
MYLLCTNLLKFNTDWTFLNQVDHDILLNLFRPQKCELNAWKWKICQYFKTAKILATGTSIWALWNLNAYIQDTEEEDTEITTKH